MMERDIQITMEELVASNEMAGAALIVRRNGQEIYRGKWGFADIENQVPVEYDTMYRLASMSKPITAAAVMQLWEKGKLHLDDAIGNYLESYEDRKSGSVTIRDLLSHSSGLGMEPEGVAFAESLMDPKDRLKNRVDRWSTLPLDFEPGTATGYSAIVGFDILGRIVEIISGQDYESYLKEYLLGPLGIKDVTFTLTEDQQRRMAKLYNTENGQHIFLETDSLGEQINPMKAGYFSGAAGMSGSVEGYDVFTSMLANEGEWNGVRVLEKETVRRMHQRGAKTELLMGPGLYWGLGMEIFADPKAIGIAVAPGTYGWSGAYGTHMFIHPDSGISATFVMNRGNIGGAGSPIARKVEELVFRKDF